MNVVEPQIWEKPSMISLDLSFTSDNTTCDQKGKLGTSLDGITGSNGTVNCGS
jgi:hypothetical protein